MVDGPQRWIYNVYPKGMNDAMKVKVAKWGNSLALRLPRVVANDLGLAPGREVDLVQDGTRLTMETASKTRMPVYRLRDLLAQIKPGKKPPPLEDWSAVETPWPDDDWSDIAPSDVEWEAMTRGSQGHRHKTGRQERIRQVRKKGAKHSRYA
jgi:antitoxin MazE